MMMPAATLQEAHPTDTVSQPLATPMLVRSWLLMLPLIFLAVHGNFSFETGGETALGGGRNLGVVGYVVIPGIAYSVVLWLIVSNLQRVLSLALQMISFTALALLTIASSRWSQEPVRSAYNGAFYLIGTLFAYYLVIRFKPKQIMSLVSMTGVLACFLGLIIVIFFPVYGVYESVGRSAGAWNGIFIDRTTAGKCMVFLLSPALVFGYRRFSYARAAYILLLLAFIFKAHAVTAYIIVFLYTVFMVLLNLSRRIERKTMLLLGSFAVAGGVLFSYVALSYAADVLALFGRDITLTGRTEIWSNLIDSVMKRPVLGYGFYAFWLGIKGESANVILKLHWVFGYAHNGMLEILLQLGFVGLLLFAVTLVQAIINAWICLRYGRSLGVDWYIGLIVLMILYNIDEATVLLPNELLSILYIVACTGLFVAARELKQNNNLRGIYS